jgi:DNA-binding PucR family transcriptional regulator
VYSFGGFLRELSINTGIDFNLINEDGKQVYYSNLKVENSQCISCLITLGNGKAKLQLHKNYEVCVSLLKYTIESKYGEIFSLREKLLIDILAGKDISIDKLNENFSFLSKGCTLILVRVEGSGQDALSIIREIYKQQDVISMVYENNIIVISGFDDALEHAKSIRESIISELYCKCTLSYGDRIYEIKALKTAYEQCEECILLGEKFGMKDEIYSYNKMVFEKMVYNINPSVKQELFVSYKQKFSFFDSEVINTIEEFINCGLNVSDAAKKLYIHRNTLIYRLDKLHKETGLDIRNFKDATVFMIAFLIWKENNKR